MIKDIKDAQRYLIVKDGDTTRRIVNITDLLRRHSPETVADYLEEYYRETGNTLARLVEKDKTDPGVDTMIATLFRLRMAISLLKGLSVRKEAA